MPENVDRERLLADLSSAQAREAATREILDLVSRSRDDQSPVFSAILKNAIRLCHAPMALLGLLNEERTHIEIASHIGARTDYFDFLQNNPPEFASNQFLAARAMQNLEVFQEVDIARGSVIGSEMQHRDQAVRKEGMRTVLFVPMQVNREALGCIILYRREVQPFTDQEIDLVEAFASQAVVAVQNARQFHEVQTANARLRSQLDRENASAEILAIIGKSRDDYSPVFNAILENAAQLCDAPVAGLHLVNDQRTHHRLTHVWGGDPGLTEVGEAWDLAGPLQVSTCIREARLIHTADLKDDPLYEAGDPVRRHLVDVEEVRTFLSVPLVKEGVAFGCFNLNRTEVRPFSDADIQLLEIFADQAVIAIENVRQFREVQERLKREKANREILEVISLNPDNEQPVFDAIINRAARLCRAPHAGLLLCDADDRHLILAAVNAEQSGYVDFLRANPHSMDDETSLSVEAVRAMEVRQYPDIEALAGGTAISKQLMNTWKLERMRTLLYVPLIKGDRAIGAIALYRLHVEEFSEDDIEILKLFAAQAVIAIDNVRQFKALEALNAELGDRVQSQVAEIERMGRLKRFLPSAVADAVVTAGDESMLSSHRALIATLFCDMRGFTAFCEAAEPEETIEVLQTYHQEMSELIDQYGGGVDQRAGDGIMVIFNDPIPADNPAGDAVRLALAMRKKMRELCAKWKKLGHRLGFGVGISFGYATVGIVGSAGRYDYTASGTSINTAARLCDMAANDEILISPRTWAAVEGVVEAESRGEVEMKGIREPVEVFAVVAE